MRLYFWIPFTAFRETIVLFVCSLLLLGSLSCKEATNSRSDATSAPEVNPGGQSSSEAKDLLMDVIRGDGWIDSRQELLDLTSALSWDHCFELYKECTLNRGELERASRGDQIDVAILERLGQLNHLEIIRYLGATLPEKIESEGHPIFYPQFHNLDLIAVLQGWAKSDPEKAMQYAKALLKVERGELPGGLYPWSEHMASWVGGASRSKDSFVYQIFSTWTKKDENRALAYLKHELPRLWIQQTPLDRTHTLRAMFWINNAIEAVCTECEFSKNFSTKVDQIHEMIEDLQKKISEPEERRKLHFTHHSSILAARWRRQDFSGALNWWKTLEKDSRVSTLSINHPFTFFDLGDLPYTQSEWDHIIAWLQENPAKWANIRAFGVIFSFFEGDDQQLVLDLICALPRNSLRATFLSDLIHHPEPPEEIGILFVTASRPKHLYSIEEVRARISELNLRPSEIELILSAMEKRQKSGHSQ